MILSKEELGKLVKEARKIKSEKIGKRYTQLMLAKDINKSQGYIGDIESGRTYPTYKVLSDISEACNVPLSFFEKNKNFISPKDIIKKSNVPYDNFTRISCEEIYNEICCDCKLEHDSLDIKEAMNSILSQTGLMLNGQLLSNESKIALANAIKLGLEYAEQLQNKEKITNK